MVQAESELIVADNTGAKTLKMIRKLGSLTSTAGIGDIIIASVKTSSSEAGVKKKSVVRAVIVRTRRRKKRKDGSEISFDDNAAVIIDANNNPKGTRVFGPVARELRDKNFMKIISLAPEVL